ncbi:MAG: hypothetical protein ACYSQZ_06115 [Planctomycetota bacterium]|jgi:hypothetical protein
MKRKKKNIRTGKFTWEGDDLKFDKSPSLPTRLKPIIEGMPPDDIESSLYLTKMLDTKKITLGEYRLILRLPSDRKVYNYE